MKKTLVLCFFLFCFLPVTSFGETQTLTIDDAIVENIKHISDMLAEESKVVVIIESESKKLSDYIIGESNVFIMTDTKLSLVDKSNLAYVLKNKNINSLNEIDESMALEIGRELGASSIIFGSISKVGANFRFRVQVVDAADGKIQGMQSFKILEDEVLQSLAGLPKAPSNESIGDSQNANNPNPNVQVVIVKDTPTETQATVQNIEKSGNKVFLGNRWQGAIYKGDKVEIGFGWEFELGKYKEQILVTSITNFNISSQSGSSGYNENKSGDNGNHVPQPGDGNGNLPPDYPPTGNNDDDSPSKDGFGGGGTGAFIAPIISAGDFFKFVPGMDVGLWIYGYDGGPTFLFGGPDVRIMFGYEFIFLDVLARYHFGLDFIDDVRKFGGKFSWGVGVSFLIGGRN